MLRLARPTSYVHKPGQKIDAVFKRNPPVTDPVAMAKRISEDFKFQTPPAMAKMASDTRLDSSKPRHMRFDSLTRPKQFASRTTRSEYHFDLININFISAVKLFVVYVPKFNDHVKLNKTQLQHAAGLIRFNNLYVSALIAKNPQVQILTYYNTTPTPYIEVHVEKSAGQPAEPVYVDCTDKSEIEILKHVQKVFGKVPEQQVLEAKQAIPKTTLFGSATVMNLVGCSRDCMCRGEGQYPCPKFMNPHVVTDKRVMGKYLRNTDLRADPYGINTDWEKQKLTEDYDIWTEYRGKFQPGEKKFPEDVEALEAAEAGENESDELDEDELEFLKNME